MTRFKDRLIYWLLSALAWLARRVPGLHLPGWVPLAGAIDGHSFAPALQIRGGKRLGRSMTVPAILKIEIDGTRGTAVPHALHPVATRLFAQHPPFTFNVSFACGAARRFRPGVYGDPRSPWFNVFAGYYEIDVAKSAWDRPFGYERAGDRWVVNTDDISRLGSADWNYFSNFMYGVPLAAIEPVDAPVATFEPPASVTLAGRRWDHVRADGMRAASAYLAHADARPLVDTVPGLTDLWRVVFGLPYRGPRGDPAESFFSTTMRAELYACFVDDGTHYRTFIFGGTVNQWWEGTDPARIALNRDLLALEMSTIAELIGDQFSHLGFAP